MIDNGLVFQNLVELAKEKDCKILFADFQGCYGRIKGNRIGIRAGMSIDEINYNLAHELAHIFLHYDKGDTIHSPEHKAYEEQADRAAKLLLQAITVSIRGECVKAGNEGIA